MRVDWCVSSWFRIKNTHSHTKRRGGPPRPSCETTASTPAAAREAPKFSSALRAVAVECRCVYVAASLPAPCYRFPQRRCSAAITAHVVVQRDYSFVCHRMCPSGAHRETITPNPPYWGFRRGVPIRFV